MFNMLTIEKVKFTFRVLEYYNDEESTIIIIFGLVRITRWRVNYDNRSQDEKPFASYFGGYRDRIGE